MRNYLFIILTLTSTAFLSQSNAQKLTISPVSKGFYVYTTFGDPGNGTLYPANGLYIVTAKGVILFDTPWDTTQFQPLLDSIERKHHQKVIMCISTHFHSDRTAGLGYYRQKGIKTYTTKRTDDLSKERNEPRAEILIYKDTLFTVGQHLFETYYPGKGHSPDNIVLWFPQQRLLYGGCFIKSTETNSPGNLSDADIDEWIESIKRVEAKFKKPAYIITGHQDWKNNHSLKHTLILLKNFKSNTVPGKKQGAH